MGPPRSSSLFWARAFGVKSPQAQVLLTVILREDSPSLRNVGDAALHPPRGVEVVDALPAEFYGPGTTAPLEAVLGGALPAPFGPMTPTTLWSATSRSTSQGLDLP